MKLVGPCFSVLYFVCQQWTTAGTINCKRPAERDCRSGANLFTLALLVSQPIQCCQNAEVESFCQIFYRMHCMSINVQLLKMKIRINTKYFRVWSFFVLPIWPICSPRVEMSRCLSPVMKSHLHFETASAFTLIFSGNNYCSSYCYVKSLKFCFFLSKN